MKYFTATFLICLGISCIGLISAQCGSNMVMKDGECVPNQAVCFMIQSMIQNFDPSQGQLQNLIMLRTMFTDELIAGCGMECVCGIETTIVGGE